MAIDVNKLSVQVESSGISDAASALDSLVISSSKAEDSAQSLAKTYKSVADSIKEQMDKINNSSSGNDTFAKAQQQTQGITTLYDKAAKDQQSIMEKRDLQLAQMRGKEYADTTAMYNKLFNDHDAYLKRQLQLDTNYYTATLKGQLDLAQKAQVYAAGGGNATDKYGSKAATADMAALTEQIKQQGIAAEAAAAHTFNFGNMTARAKTEVVVLAHEMLQGNWTRFGSSMMVMAELTGAASGIIAALVNPITLVVAALAALGYALYNSTSSFKELKVALQDTNNYSGQTAQGLVEMGNQLSISTGRAGASKEAILALAASGKFSSEAMMQMGEAAVAMSMNTGQSVTEVVAELAQMVDDVVKFADKYQQTHHTMSGADRERIKSLQDAGQAEKAAMEMAKLMQEQSARLHEQELENAGLFTMIGEGWKQIYTHANVALGDFTRTMVNGETVENKLIDAHKNEQAALTGLHNAIMMNSKDVAQWQAGLAMVRIEIANLNNELDKSATKVAEQQYKGLSGDLASKVGAMKADPSHMDKAGRKAAAITEEEEKWQGILRVAQNANEARVKANLASNENINADNKNLETAIKLHLERLKGIDEEYRDKGGAKTENDIYRAQLAVLEGQIQDAKSQLKQTELENNAAFQRGEIGKYELTQKNLEAQQQAIAKEINLRKQELSIAQTPEDVRAKKQELRNSEEQARNKGLEDAMKADLDFANYEKNLDKQITDQKVRELEARGQYVDAAQVRYTEASKISMSQIQQDIEFAEGQLKDASGKAMLDGGTAIEEWSKKLTLAKKALQQLEDSQSAAINAATLKEDQAIADSIFSKLKSDIESINEKASEGGGWVARFISAQQISDLESKTLPQMKAALDKIREGAYGEGGTDAAKKNYEKIYLEWTKLMNKQDTTYKSFLDGVSQAGQEGFEAIFSNVHGSWSSYVAKMKNTFKTTLVDEIYKMFARPFVLQLVGSFAGMLGFSGLSQAANLAGGASSGASALSGVGGIGQGISGLYNLFTGGAGQAFNNFAMGGIGQSLGLSTVGGSAAEEIAGLTGSGLGGGVGSSLTTLGSIGSSLAAVAPYLAVAAVLYKGLSMGDKQMTGQNVTGSFGAGGQVDATRNVSWTQSGGFLRSDRSGTWNYNLANSTAIADGKAYQDTASVQSDQTIKAALESTYASLKTSTEGYAKALGLNADSINTRTDSINFAIGKDNAETSANIQKMFSGIADAMATDLFPSLSKFAALNETASQTLQRVATDFQGMNDILKALGLKLFSVDDAGISASEGLVKLLGGLQSAQSITASYYNNFYSATDKANLQTKQLTDAFNAASLGALPTTTAEYKKLVEQIQKTGTPEQLATVLQLSTAFTNLTSTLDTVKQEADAVQAAYHKQTQDWQTFQGKQQDQQIQAMTLQGNAAGALSLTRYKELAAMDAALQPMQKYIYQLQDQATALATATALQAKADQQKIQLLTLEGDTVGATALQRKDELAAMDESLRPMQQRIYALTDEAAATASATALADKRLALEVQIAQLQGDTAGANALQRAHDLALLDPSLRGLQQEVYSLTDKQAATQAVTTATSNLTSAYNSQKSAIDSIVTSTQSFITSIEAMKNTISIGNLSTLSPQQQYDQLKATLPQLEAGAQAGDQASLSGLKQFLDISKSFNAATTAYSDDYNAVMSILNKAEASKVTALAVAQSQLEQLKASVSGLIAVDTSIESGSAAVVKAINELRDAMGGNGSGTSTSAAAIAASSAPVNTTSYASASSSATKIANPLDNVSQDAIFHKLQDYALQKYNVTSANGGVSKLGSLVTPVYQDLVYAISDQINSHSLTASSIATLMSQYSQELDAWVSPSFSTKATGSSQFDISSILNSYMDGSHANGLDRVPFDGYRAILHEGERVQTAAAVSEEKVNMADVADLLKTVVAKLEAANAQRGFAATETLKKLDKVVDGQTDIKRVAMKAGAQ